MRQNRYWRKTKIYSPGHARAISHIRDFNELQCRLGDGLRIVLQFVERMDEPTWTRLIHLYRQYHGSAAANYAVETRNAWFSGKRRISGQTAQRFVELAPKIMSKDERFQTALAIRNTHVRKNIIYKRYRLRVSRKLSSKSIQNATRRAIDDALTIANRRDNDTWKKLAAWLADGDIAVLERIRQGFEKAEIRIDKEVAARRLMSLAADAQQLVPDLRTWKSEAVFEAPGLQCSLRLVGIEPEMDKKEERERNKRTFTAVICLLVAIVALISIT